MSGLRTACLYSLKPHQLGFCTPPQLTPTSLVIQSFLEGKSIDPRQIKEILKKFYTAYPMYCLIAQKNNLKDPFREEIVRAYWLGNDYLQKAGGVKLHHMYHVYTIGARTRQIISNDEKRDFCRIAWAQVTNLGKKLSVNYQPIKKNQGKYYLGRTVQAKVEWNQKILEEVKKGDMISVHWQQAVEVLNETDLSYLMAYTRQCLASF